MDIQKIALLGAESSGKTTLAQALAQSYETVWVPEYLREFTEEKKRAPIESEQLHIAQTQVQRELAMEAQARQYLFCDSSPLMIALYSEHYFKNIGAELSSLVEQHDYDMYIVTAPDFPWQADGIQRDSPALQKHMHQRLMAYLEEQELPFLLAEGSVKQRVEQVRFALDFLGA
jgi:NadR type nicotinamide-nucleotide adenylyltransferase